MKSFPPGFGFFPKDEELLILYLRKKILHEPYPLGLIVDENVYGHHPQYLTDHHRMLNRLKEWFFFTPEFQRHEGSHGKRPSRRAGSGRWKATESMKRVLDSNRNVLGCKQTFEYLERSPSGEEIKSAWFMDEYLLEF